MTEYELLCNRDIVRSFQLDHATFSHKEVLKTFISTIATHKFTYHLLCCNFLPIMPCLFFLYCSIVKKGILTFDVFFLSGILKFMTLVYNLHKIVLNINFSVGFSNCPIAL